MFVGKPLIPKNLKDPKKQTTIPKYTFRIGSIALAYFPFILLTLFLYLEKAAASADLTVAGTSTSFC